LLAFCVCLVCIIKNQNTEAKLMENYIHYAQQNTHTKSKITSTTTTNSEEEGPQNLGPNSSSKTSSKETLEELISAKQCDLKSRNEKVASILLNQASTCLEGQLGPAADPAAPARVCSDSALDSEAPSSEQIQSLLVKVGVISK
jgi:hypothetical protein